MKLDIAIQKYLSYRKFVQKVHKCNRLNDRGALTRFHEFMFTKYSNIVDLDEVSLDDFIEYSEILSTKKFRRWRSHAKNIKLCHNSLVNHQRKIRQFFRFCHENQFMQTNLSKVQIWNIERREELSVLSHDEIRQFFEICKQNPNSLKGLRDELLFRIAYYTWLRKNEILNLTFEQVLSENQFQITWKMARQRTVYFDDESKIRQLALELKYLYVKKYWNDWNDYIFRAFSPNNHWNILWRSTVYLTLVEYKKKLWIDPKRRLTLHSFRHTFATTLLENGANLREVQLLLWHSSLKSTAYYTHVSAEKLRQCSSLLHLS